MVRAVTKWTERTGTIQRWSSAMVWLPFVVRWWARACVLCLDDHDSELLNGQEESRCQVWSDRDCLCVPDGAFCDWPRQCQRVPAVRCQSYPQSHCSDRLVCRATQNRNRHRWLAVSDNGPTLDSSGKPLVCDFSHSVVYWPNRCWLSHGICGFWPCFVWSHSSTGRRSSPRPRPSLLPRREWSSTTASDGLWFRVAQVAETNECWKPKNGDLLEDRCRSSVAGIFPCSCRCGTSNRWEP